jgi:hypothetical protein
MANYIRPALAVQPPSHRVSFCQITVKVQRVPLPCTLTVPWGSICPSYRKPCRRSTNRPSGLTVPSAPFSVRTIPFVIVSVVGGPADTVAVAALRRMPTPLLIRLYIHRRTPSLSARGLVQQPVSPTCKPQSSRVLSSDQTCLPPSRRPKSRLRRVGCLNLHLCRPIWMHEFHVTAARVLAGQSHSSCKTPVRMSANHPQATLGCGVDAELKKSAQLGSGCNIWLARGFAHPRPR